MRSRQILIIAAGIFRLFARAASAQATAQHPTPAFFPTTDSTIERIWRIGMDSSALAQLAQPLLDSIGPRLDGSPGLAAAQRWLSNRYKEWGVPVRLEQYGTQRAWQRVS